MKILLITAEYPPMVGGVSHYYEHLVKHSEIEVLVLPLQRGLLKYFQWRKILKKHDYDLLLVGQILPFGTLALLQSKPYAVMLHGMDYSLALKKKVLAKVILNRAHKIIAANSYVANLVKKFCYTSTIIVNPGIDEIILPDVLEVENLKFAYELNDSFVMLSMGRLVKRKGVDKTLEALKYLPEVVARNITYVILGSGPDAPYLEKLAESYQNQGGLARIIFLNKTFGEAEKWQWLSACDLFILPARDILGDFEGFGIVYLEAGLAKKPIIAGKAGGVSDAVVDGFNGLLVDPLNPRAIADNIIKLYQDEGLRLQLGVNGNKRAIEEFNWHGQAAKLIQGL